MLNFPLHDLLIHFPLVLGVVIPVIALFLVVGIEQDWCHESSWLVLPMLGLLNAGFCTAASGFSEAELAVLRQHIDNDILYDHMKLAELVPLTAAIVCILAPLPVILTDKRKMRWLFLLISAIGVWPVVTVAMSHAELVYRHGVGCLPAGITLPSQNSTEQEPANENPSSK